MTIIYNREQGNKAIKNMQKTSQNNRTAIDKSTNLVYNTTMLNKTTTTKEKKMTFKIHENDYNRALSLYSRLHENGIEVWMKLNTNDMSDCQWRFIDNPSPHCFGTMEQPLNNGGVGALINDLLQACYNHGIMKRPDHISRRNPVRLSSDANGKSWTIYNGG